MSTPVDLSTWQEVADQFRTFGTLPDIGDDLLGEVGDDPRSKTVLSPEGQNLIDAICHRLTYCGGDKGR